MVFLSLSMDWENYPSVSGSGQVDLVHLLGTAVVARERNGSHGLL